MDETVEIIKKRIEGAEIDQERVKKNMEEILKNTKDSWAFQPKALAGCIRDNNGDLKKCARCYCLPSCYSFIEQHIPENTYQSTFNQT